MILYLIYALEPNFHDINKIIIWLQLHFGLQLFTFGFDFLAEKENINKVCQFHNYYMVSSQTNRISHCYVGKI